MDLSNVMDEIAGSLETLPGLRVFPYLGGQMTPPAACIGWPDPLTFDGAFGRGMDRCEIPLWVMVGAVDARSSRDRLAAYLNGSAVGSVKAAVDGDGGSYTACDSVRVASATVGPVSVAGVEYLAAMFIVEITGSGA